MMNVSIRQIPPRRVIAIGHRGPYPGIGEAFDRLRRYAESRGLASDLSGSIGLFYDDPSVTPESDLRSAACVDVANDFTPGPGDPVEVLTITGGEYAVAVHRGPYAALGDCYRWLYREWLPSSGRAGADRPEFEIYLNDCATTPEEELETAIHVPLE